MSPLRSERFLSAAVALLLAAVAAWLALGTTPGLGPLDAGDMTTASATLGVPHATGFPVHTLLGRALMWLPVGNLAHRAALGSAFLTAVAICGVAWLAQAGAKGAATRAALATAAALSAALIVHATETLSLHAAVAEVYALHLALTVGALVAVERLQRTGDARWAIALATIAGLGIANHALFRLQAPVLVVAAWWLTPRGARLRTAIAGLTVGTAALLAYAYLPLAALRTPMHNWGDPSTLARLWAHITAADIRAAYGEQMTLAPSALAPHARVLASQLASGPGVALIAGVGALALGARRSALATCALAFVTIDALYAVALNPMGLRDAQNGQVLALLGGVGFVLGCAYVAERQPERARAAAGWALLLPLFILPQSDVRHGSLARDWSAEDHAVATLLYAAPEPIVITTTDTMTAAQLYFDAAIDARPDAAVFGRHILSDGRAAAYALGAQPFEVVPAGALEAWTDEGLGGEGPRAAAVLAANGGQRDIHWEPAIIASELPRGLQLVHRWPLGLVADGRAQPDECAPAAWSWCEGLPPWAAEARAAAGSEGYFAGRFVAKQISFRAARALRAGQPVQALQLFEIAHAYDSSLPNFATGAAVASATLGRVDEALRWSLEALRINPASETARRNATQYAEQLGRADVLDALRRGRVPRAAASRQAP